MIATAADNQLGCYEYGICRFLRQGRVVFETDTFNCSWNRVNDEVSTASFTIESIANCCPSDIHARTDIVEFERNGHNEWTGYVMRPYSVDNVLTIEAMDLLYGYQRRIIRDPLQFSQIDITTIAQQVLASADGPDPIPIVPIFQLTGILADRIFTTGEYRIAWDAFVNDLLQVGLDITMVGALCYVGPLEDRGLLPLKLNERMILGVPGVGEDGQAYASRIIVKGGNGLVSVYPAGPAVSTPPFPLDEVVIDANDTTDQTTLDRLAKEHYDLRFGVPRYVNLSEGVSLKTDSPYPLRAYIPGRLVDTTIDTACYKFQEGQRLQNVSYSLTRAVEDVKIATVPMGLVAEGVAA